MQGPSGRAGEENTEKVLTKMLWDLESSEVGKIYRKSYILQAMLNLWGLFDLCQVRSNSD